MGHVVAAVAPGQRIYTDHRGGIAVEANRQHIAANGPPVTLALVAYIRKLEAVALQYARHLEVNSETDPFFEDRDRIRALVDGGAVLP